MFIHKPECVAFVDAAADFGLFLADEDPKKGVWLEAGRTLEYYLLRNQVWLFCNGTGRLYVDLALRPRPLGH